MVTPGPWFVRDGRNGQLYIAVAADTFARRIATVDAHPNCEADAMLIAQAPALYAAAKKVLEGFREEIFVRGTTGDVNPEWAMRVLPYISALARLEEAYKLAEISHAPQAWPNLSEDGIK